MIAAMNEVGAKIFQTLGPRAVQAARAILADPKHPAHGRLVETVLERTGLMPRGEHRVVVEHKDDAAMLEIAARLALELGVDRARLVGSGGGNGVGQVIEDEGGQGEVVDAEVVGDD